MIPSHRRKHYRHGTFLPAKVRIKGTFVWIKASVHNVSKTGLLIELDVKGSVPQATRLEIELTTEDRTGKSNTRKLNAIVAWRRGNRYGIQFT